MGHGLDVLTLQQRSTKAIVRVARWGVVPASSPGCPRQCWGESALFLPAIPANAPWVLAAKLGVFPLTDLAV